MEDSIPAPDPDEIQRASELIDPAFTRSPVVRRSSLDEALGCSVLLKVETLNPIRSFKGRGASWYMQNSSSTNAVVTASAGNFGQGIAYAARRAGRQAVIFAAQTANPGKLRAMRRLGARVEVGGHDFDAAMSDAVAWSSGNDGTLVVDGANPRIAEGAGTIALELDREVGEPIEHLLVPLGNGALACGVGTWMRHARPGTSVIAVAASGAPAMSRSWRTGQLVRTPSVETIADGIAIRNPLPYALDVMREVVSDVVEVDDSDISRAMSLAFVHVGLLLEPAGAAGLAAIVADPSRFAGRTVATVLCGSNIDDRILPSLMRDAQELAAASAG